MHKKLLNYWPDSPCIIIHFLLFLVDTPKFVVPSCFAYKTRNLLCRLCPFIFYTLLRTLRFIFPGIKRSSPIRNFSFPSTFSLSTNNYFYYETTSTFTLSFNFDVQLRSSTSAFSLPTTLFTLRLYNMLNCSVVILKFFCVPFIFYQTLE